MTCIAFALLVAAGGVAGAQGLEKLQQTTPAERATASTAAMKEKLGLSPEKLKKVEAINLAHAEKMDPVIKGSGGRIEKLREARKLGQAHDAELEKVLTPEQYSKYRADKDAMREKIEKKLIEKRGNAS